MKVAYNNQMKAIDNCAITDYGIPGILLMENAAICVVRAIESYKQSGRVIIFCGQGNNGGDGFAIARHLSGKNYEVEVCLVGSPEELKGDAKINYNIITRLNMTISIINEQFPLEVLPQKIKDSDLVLDCLFGTGLSREVSGIYLEVIDKINTFSPYTIAIDIPSGINGDTGEIMGIAIKADETVTFALPKVGNLLYPGAYYCGELKVVDIGIPKEMAILKEINVSTLIEKEALSQLPSRLPWSNKGSYGKVTLIAGSPNMPGAAILAGKAAYRIGAGLVHLVIPERIQAIIQQGLVEAVTLPYGIDGSGYIINRDSLDKMIDQSTVIGIGPGLGQDKYARELLEYVLKKSSCPLVVDADGLNLMAQNREWFNMCNSQVIITPHIGEMSRLTDKNLDDIKENIIATAKAFSKEYNVICVLKDARTIIATPQGEIYINLSGNHGMSTAGSGDVLTGIICGLIAQGSSCRDAAMLGVYFHGASGDWIAKEKGKRSLMAGDLCEGLGGILC